MKSTALLTSHNGDPLQMAFPINVKQHLLAPLICHGSSIHDLIKHINVKPFQLAHLVKGELQSDQASK